MILLMCFLAAFGLGRCLDPLQSRLDIETSINRTINEVERLIKIDPTLPQLSRSQIVDILYNITTNDMDSIEESVENTRLDYQRALTVVLPYNSKDAKNEDIRDLYTKPPMIHIIPDSQTMLPYSSIQEELPVSSDPIRENLIGTKYPAEDKNKFPITNNEYKNHRTTYDELMKVELIPQKINLNPSKVTWPTTSSISKLINSGNDRNSTTKSKLEIIYSTSVTDKPTTRMIKTTTLRPSGEFRPTMPPTKKSTVNVLTSDQWKYFAPPSKTITTTTTSTEMPSTTTKRLLKTTTRLSRPSAFRHQPRPFLPTVMSTSSEWPTHPTPPPTKKIYKTSTNAPDVITFNMADMEMMSDEATPMLFVTPMSSKSPEKIVNSLSTVGSIAEQQQKTSKTPSPMRDDVATLLASIGLKPNSQEIVGDNKINLVNEQGIFATNFKIPLTNNTPLSYTSALTGNKVDSPSIVNQNTFDNAHKDVEKGVNNLSPDVQLLFQRFGLQTSETKATSTTTTVPTRVSFKTNSWNNFKPLPKSEIKDETMKNFLAKYGLGVAENRNKKSMKSSQQHSIIDAVPSTMKNILENLGLIVRPKAPRNIRTTSKTAAPITTTELTEDPAKIHVFKPHEVIVGDPEQKSKINELLDTVKLVQEGEADVSDVRKVADDLLKTTTILQDGPNPLSLDEILKIHNNDVKNEVKRQESKANLLDDTTTNTSNSDLSEVKIEISGDNSSNNSSDSAAESSDSADTSHNDSDARIVTSSVTTATATTTTESSSSTEDSNLDALADSFGGSTAEPDPVLPTPKKSGLYFLVDWNSFLEVGVDGEDKVNLRFAPKVGDRTRFIPVVVP